MPKPKTREEFKEYCLRKLGKPVLHIDVSDEQVDDRVDESLSYYWDYHYDGSTKIYLKHQITQEDKDNGFITIPDSVIGAVRIFDFNEAARSASQLFNIEYQMMHSMVHNMSNFDLTNYYMSMQHIAFVDDILNGTKMIRYNRHQNKLHVDMNWSKVPVGHYLIVECYQVNDPEQNPDVWGDRFLQNYATAKIKYQWGSNLTKFENMQMPGGVVFNGQQILADARDEIEKLEDEMVRLHSMPLTDMFG